MDIREDLSPPPLVADCGVHADKVVGAICPDRATVNSVVNEGTVKFSSVSSGAKSLQVRWVRSPSHGM